MQLRLKKLGFTASAAMTFAAVLNWQGASAAAEALQPTLVESAPQVAFTAAPIVQPLPAVEKSVEAAQEAPTDQAGSLAELVAAHGQPEELSPEMQCLAGAIYFEAKGQTLAGQLAVGRVIIGRTKSGRFPESYCGVVYQRWQKPEAVYEYYTSAAEKVPNELPYVMARAEMLVTMDRVSEALALLQEKVVFFEHSAAIRDATEEPPDPDIVAAPAPVGIGPSRCTGAAETAEEVVPAGAGRTQ